jgi:hypothetical protein
MDPALKVNKFE